MAKTRYTPREPIEEYQDKKEMVIPSAKNSTGGRPPYYDFAGKSGKERNKNSKPGTSKRKAMSEAQKKKRQKERAAARKKKKEEEALLASVPKVASKPAHDDDNKSDSKSDEETESEDEEKKRKVPLSRLKDPNKNDGAAPGAGVDSAVAAADGQESKKATPKLNLLKPFHQSKKQKVDHKSLSDAEDPTTTATTTKLAPPEKSIVDPAASAKDQQPEVVAGDSVVLKTPKQPKKNVDAQVTTTESKESCSSMSFTNLDALTPSNETKDEVISSLKDAFSSNVVELESLSNEVLPNINTLPPKAINFFLSIFGHNDILPASHVVEDLVMFVPICTSFKFASLAEHKMKKDKSHQFRLRYFGGVGDQDSETLTDRNNPKLELVDCIRMFYTSIFNNPENQHIDDCVRRARSLFITAKTLSSRRGRAKNGDGKAGDQQASEAPCSLDEKEEIIACINFAFLDGYGFFVNWLATTSEKVDPKKYGDELMVLCGQNSTFQHRHLALFLMKAVNFAVVTHLRLKNTLSPNDYIIVLQARVTANEKSAKFYGSIGFDEVGPLDDESSLSKEVFPTFPVLMEQAKNSTSDYIHYIWDSLDICVFKNTTGSFGKVRSFSRRFKNVSYMNIDFTKNKDEFFFPFAMQRRNLMLLASNLEMFFLPFLGSTEKEEDYIEPNSVYTDRLTTMITSHERNLLMKGKKGKAKWLNDECIDFYIRW